MHGKTALSVACAPSPTESKTDAAVKAGTAAELRRFLEENGVEVYVDGAGRRCIDRGRGFVFDNRTFSVH